MIYDYLITNKFSASYGPDVMIDMLKLLERDGGIEISKKIFKSKVITFEQIDLSILDLPKNKLQQICRLVPLRFKQDIQKSLPYEPGFCSVFLIHSDQWGFLIVKKEENGNLSGIYNQPDGQSLGLFNHCSTTPKYPIKLNVSKIFDQLGINVQNISLKTNVISKADSGAVTIAHLVNTLFYPEGFLYNVFSPEDIANLRTIHAFVPDIIQKMLDKNKIQDAQNMFLNFINSQIRSPLVEGFVQDLHNKLPSFGFAKNELNVFKEATSHIDMTKDKDFCDKIDQLLTAMQEQTKQNIKTYQHKKILSNIKLDMEGLNLIKQQSEEYAEKALKKQIKAIFPKDYNLSELFECILYRNNLRFKVYIEDLIESSQEESKECGSKIDFIDNLQNLILSRQEKNKKDHLPTIFEAEEEKDPDFGPWDQKDDSIEVDLSGLNLADAVSRLDSV